MALTTAAEIAKKGFAQPDRLYFFYGRDVGNMELVTKKLLSKLVSKGDEALNMHRFDAKELDVGQFADAVMAVPMFAPRVCAYISGFNADKLPKDDVDALKEILSDIPDTTTVLICCDGENVFKTKKALSDKNKRFADHCVKLGTVCDFAYRRANDMGKYIAQEIAAAGSSISSYDAQYLANMLQSDTALVDNEIAKLTAFADGRPIDRQMIDLLCVPKIESDGFSLALNILRGNADFVFRRIDELVSQQYKAVEILGTISYSIMDIYRAKLARASGRTAADVIKDFNYPAYKKFAVDNAYTDCGRISLERIRTVMKILSDTDLLLKTRSLTGGADILALEQCAAKCMAARQ